MIRDYLNSGLVSAETGDTVLRSGPVAVRGVRVRASGRDVQSALLREDTLHVEVDFELTADVPELDLAVFLTTGRGVRVLDEVLSDHAPGRLAAGHYRAEMEIPPLLNVGDFAVGLWFGTTTTEFLSEPAAATFTLHGSDRQRPDRTVVLDLPIKLTAV